jgi:DNA mismatch repair protein MSH4
MSSILESGSPSLFEGDTGRFNQSLRSGRLTTARPTTAATTIATQEVICAISESRGVSPTVGLTFINLTTSEAVLCQICDSQSYVKTMNKLGVFDPSELLFMRTTREQQSKLYYIIQDNLPDIPITSIDRRYWSDQASHDYVDRLAFPDEVESIKVLLDGHYFAACCLAAVCRSITMNYHLTDFL